MCIAHIPAGRPHLSRSSSESDQYQYRVDQMKVVFLSVCAVLNFCSALGQPVLWEPTNGPLGGNVRTIAVNAQGEVFIGNADGGCLCVS